MNDSGNVLVVAAHADDEVLGCGGTIAKLAALGRSIHIVLIADGESSRLNGISPDKTHDYVNARKAAAEKAAKILGCASIECLGLPDNQMDTIPLLNAVKIIEERIAHYTPTTVLSHYCNDVNIDHQVVHEAINVACRPTPGHCVKELIYFEVMSSTEWRASGSLVSFNPNFFVDISAFVEVKNSALKAYSSELRDFPHPRSIQAVEALMRWRGATVGVDAAEAFIIGRKIA